MQWGAVGRCHNVRLVRQAHGNGQSWRVGLPVFARAFVMPNGGVNAFSLGLLENDFAVG